MNLTRLTLLVLVLTVSLANIASTDEFKLLGSYPIDQAKGVHVSTSNHLLFSDAMDATTIEKIRSLTTATVGTDGCLYGADAFGNLYRWQFSDDGVPVQREVIWQDARKSRHVWTT